MDGDFGYPRDPRQIEANDLTDEGFGAVRGALFAVAIQAAIAIGWGVWRLVGSVFS